VLSQVKHSVKQKADILEHLLQQKKSPGFVKQWKTIKCQLRVS
jgi:hypothetical protein